MDTWKGDSFGLSEKGKWISADDAKRKLFRGKKTDNLLGKFTLEETVEPSASEKQS